MRIWITCIFAVSLLAADPESTPLPRHILTNDGLVVLARAGLGDGLIVDLVRNKRTLFDTSAEALAVLARNGLSENVLRAVVEKQEQVQLRKPQLVVTPLGGTVAEGPGTMAVQPGEVILMPPGRRGRSEADRWYKVSMR